MAAMPYPAYVSAAFAICRPDKRSAIRQLWQPCTMPDRLPDGGDALSGLRGCNVLLCVGLISEAPSGSCGNRAQCQTDCRMAAMPYPAYVGAAFCYA